MNIRCAKCGQAALDTDSTCWHCGEPLPGREKAGRKEVKVRESWTRGTGPASIVIFGGLTFLVFLSAILLMGSLGRQPQLQVRLGTRTQSGWTFITAADRIFTVTLPNDWFWLDEKDPESAAGLRELLAEQPRLRLTTHPLGAETDDMSILFVAGSQLSSDGQTPILVVASSPLLNRLTYQEALNFLSNSDYDIKRVRFVDDFDKSHLSIEVDTHLETIAKDDGPVEAIRCRQQFVLGREQSLLISLCAPPDRFAAHTRTFDEIMTSFQHLET